MTELLTVQQQSLESAIDPLGWVGTPVISGSAVSRSTVKSHDGSASLRIEAVDEGSGTESSIAAVVGSVSSFDWKVVTAGTSYDLSAWFLKDAIDDDLRARIEVGFYDAGFMSLGFFFSGGSSLLSSVSWTEESMTVVAPVGATQAFMAVIIDNVTPATFAVGDGGWVDTMSFADAAVAEDVIGHFVLGGLQPLGGHIAWRGGAYTEDVSPSSTSIDAQIPSGVQNGDFVVMARIQPDGPNGPTPSGWDDFGFWAPPNAKLQVATRTWHTGDPLSQVFTQSTAGARETYAMAYDNAGALADALDDQGFADTSWTTYPSGGYAADARVYVLFIVDTMSPISQPGGWSELYHSLTSPADPYQLSVWIRDPVLSAGDTLPAQTFTATTATDWFSLTFYVLEG